MAQAKLVSADPLYKPICPRDIPFLEMTSEAFSGRLFRDRIPNLISYFHLYFQEVL